MKLLPNHRAHDAQHLIQRWGVLARQTGCLMDTLCMADDLPVIILESVAAQQGQPAIYLSSGVHGDEAGAAWGLLAWAEKHAQKLRDGSFLIAPLINPVGLMLNTRADHRGIDLNRHFHVADDLICGAWQRWITGRAMRFGLCLHEDYDGQGVYLYELNHASSTSGHEIIKRCDHVIPPDPRRDIDGQEADHGVIRRRDLPKHLPGMPEAVELHLRNCPLTLTFETPSEFDLDTRVRSQVAFIEAAITVLSV
ncbi:MAG TPA: M14 family metallocarboxypeptidase [Prosthecobacter sp.]